MVHVMSEVKGMIEALGDKICNADSVDPVKRYTFKGAAGEYVYAPDFDAQRLRADTAEAERDKWETRACSEATKLHDAEQRIAELSADNQLLRKLLEQTLAALNPSAKLSKSIRAALNPKTKAGSHE